MKKENIIHLRRFFYSLVFFLLSSCAYAQIFSGGDGDGFDQNCDLPLEVYAGDCEVVYYGYSPAECITLYANVTGGIPPYTILWSNGSINQSIEVCPSTTTSYNVMVTDAVGTHAQDNVNVVSVDVTCGNNSDKVQICHNSKTRCVSPNAVQAHLENHDDYLGPCAYYPCGNNSQNIIYFNAYSTDEMHVELLQYIDVQNQPNLFVLEKSIDKINFQTLFEQNAFESWNNPKESRYLDKNPEEGINYYRLKIIYSDGTFEYSQIKEVPFNPDSEFTLFPNPSNEQVKIYMKRFLGKKVDVLFMNTMGVIVHQLQIDKVQDLILPVSLDNAVFNEGIYFVSIVHKGKAYSKRLVITKL